MTTDDPFVQKWQRIFATTHMHAELESLKFDGVGVIYLGRALYHAYHAEIDEYVAGRAQPDGGFDTSIGGVPVMLDATMGDEDMRAVELP